MFYFYLLFFIIYLYIYLKKIKNKNNLSKFNKKLRDIIIERKVYDN